MLTSEQAVLLLQDAKSAKRRQGAKRLRVLADRATAADVADALVKEFQDPRTWETQYQLVMALGATGTSAQVPMLQALATQPRKATFVNAALGDAVVRLGRADVSDPAPLLWCLSQGVPQLDVGALRATAKLRLRLDESTVEDVLDHVDLQDEDADRDVRFWTAVAAAGWQGARVQGFLTTCTTSNLEILAEAARGALDGRYRDDLVADL